jgi:hypothetical protein
MATRTWIGGGNSNASNAADWSPSGTPKPGDSLSVTGPLTQPFPSYTMSVYGNALADDTVSTWAANLTLNDYSAMSVTVSVQLGSDTINLATGSTLNLATSGFVYTFGGSATVNITGNANLKLTDGGHTTVNILSNHGRWTGTFDVIGYHSGALTINSGQNAEFLNNGASSVSFSANVVVPTTVIGTGTFSVSSGARLEFVSGVSGQTIAVESTAAGYGGGKLVLDHARQFAGEVILGRADAVPMRAAPEIDLLALGAVADSYSFKNDMLSIFAGHKVIDTLRLHDSTQFGFEVEKTTGGVSILAYTDAAHTKVGSALPIHSGGGFDS